MKNDIKKIQTDLREIEDDLLNPTFAMEKLTEVEDRSRRNNVRTNGISETSNETWENCEEEVTKIIRNKSDITNDIEIDFCHRMGKFQRNKAKYKVQRSKTSTRLCKMRKSYKTKEYSYMKISLKQ